MLTILAMTAIIAAFGLILSDIRYLRNQFDRCKRYPFYRLRDKIILKIAESEESEQYMEMYDLTNFVLSKLDKFNFGFLFYSEVLTRAFQNLIEKAYQNEWRIDDDLIKKMREECPIPPFGEEFRDLLLETAKKNSLLLRFAMTKTGYKLLCATQFIRAIRRFFIGHPELYNKVKTDRVKTYQGYSYLNQLRYATA